MKAAYLLACYAIRGWLISFVFECVSADVLVFRSIGRRV